MLERRILPWNSCWWVFRFTLSFSEMISQYQPLNFGYAQGEDWWVLVGGLSLFFPVGKRWKGLGEKISARLDVLTTKTPAFQVLLIFFYNFLVVLCKIAEWIHELMRSLRTSAIKRGVKCPRFYFKHNATFPRHADEKILGLERRSTCRTPREPQSRDWNRTPVLNQFYPCHRCLGLSNPWIYFFL